MREAARAVSGAAAAGFLLVAPVAGSEPPIVIPVTIAVDASFRAYPSWSQSVGRALSRANDTVGAPIGVRFEVGKRAAWEPAGATIDDHLRRLRRQVPAGRGGVVIGLTARRAAPRDVFGVTDYVDARTVLSIPDPDADWARELSHELGHVLGAVDVEDDDGLMAARGSGTRLDPVNLRLMALHRDRRFPPASFPLEDGRLEAAARLYREVASSSPAEAYRALARLQRARVDLATAHLARGDARSAEREARRALGGVSPEASSKAIAGPAAPSQAIAPLGLEAHEVLAAALLELGRGAEAVASLEAALQRAASDAAALSRIGVGFERAGLPARARQAHEAALRLEPRLARALTGRGRVRLGDGDAAGAAEDLQRAVDEDADDGAAWINLAAACLRLGRYGEAEDAARRGLTLRPGSPEALTTLALVEEQQGDLAQAIELQTRAVELAGGDADLLANLGTLQARAGRRADALATYQRLLALRPDDGACHNDVAVLYFREGRMEEARQHAARALALEAPVSPDFLRALARASGEEPRASAP